ncbi:hypothetical protein J6590_069833 [Homalodisca vitripennis]|nr:hypothetical protein J6590_069833 [Homalodisca vitripennis]
MNIQQHANVDLLDVIIRVTSARAARSSTFRGHFYPRARLATLNSCILLSHGEGSRCIECCNPEEVNRPRTTRDRDPANRIKAIQYESMKGVKVCLLSVSLYQCDSPGLMAIALAHHDTLMMTLLKDMSTQGPTDNSLTSAYWSSIGGLYTLYFQKQQSKPTARHTSPSRVGAGRAVERFICPIRLSEAVYDPCPRPHFTERILPAVAVTPTGGEEGEVNNPREERNRKQGYTPEVKSRPSESVVLSSRGVIGIIMPRNVSKPITDLETPPLVQFIEPIPTADLHGFP